MREKFKNLKVGKKLEKSYFTILGAFVVTLIVAIFGIAIMNRTLDVFYQESYTNTKLQLEIRKDIQMVGKNVLWAVTMEDAEKAQEKIDVAATYAGYVGTNVEALEKNFDDEFEEKSDHDNGNNVDDDEEEDNEETKAIREALAAGSIRRNKKETKSLEVKENISIKQVGECICFV